MTWWELTSEWLGDHFIEVLALVVSAAAFLVAWRAHRARAFRPVWVVAAGSVVDPRVDNPQMVIRATNTTRDTAIDAKILHPIARSYELGFGPHTVPVGESVVSGDISWYDIDRVEIHWKTPGGREHVYVHRTHRATWPQRLRTAWLALRDR